MEIIIYKDRKSIPSRSKNDNLLIFDDHVEFKPNISPEEVLRSGAFGGT